MRRVVSILFLTAALYGCGSSTTMVQLSGAKESTLFLQDSAGAGSQPSGSSAPSSAPSSPARGKATTPTPKAGA
jgi:hypothetical protein